MPVNVAVDNEEHLFVTYFQGRVPVDEALQAIEDLGGAAVENGFYRGLVVFERDVDLSEWDGAALITMRQRAAGHYRRLGLVRGESAAVVNLVPEAQLVMRLWNALCELNWDIDMAFNVFWDLAPAMRFLELSPDLRQRISDLVSARH
jgi:hypothetical protein